MNELIKLIATTEVEGGQVADTIEVSTPEQVTPEATEGVVETQVETPEVPSKYNIDGEEYDLDTLREWKKSGLRQSDYTKKTQEIASLRKQLQEAEEVYNYLQGKPDLLKKLVEMDSELSGDVQAISSKVDPVQKQIQELQTQLKIKDIDAEIHAITSKDKLVSDVELLEIATKQNCDINTAYNIWRGNNLDKILAEREKELKRSITETIQKNQTITKTLINPTDVTAQAETYGLSDGEIAFAERLGMSAKEYSDYKNPNKKYL